MPGAARRAAPVLLGVPVAAVLLLGAAGCAAERTAGPGTSAPSATSLTSAGSWGAGPGLVDRSSPPAPIAQGEGGPRGPGPGAVAVTDPGGSRPVRISVPDLRIDASTIDLGIRADGAIEVPEDPAEVGWLDTTPAPGRQGPAVLAGHRDSTTGPAVFFELATLRVGAEIVVERADGSTARFTVDGVRTYAQNAFPTAEVYGPVPGPALRLITCGGDFDSAAGGYQDNVVVYAS